MYPKLVSAPELIFGNISKSNSKIPWASCRGLVILTLLYAHAMIHAKLTHCKLWLLLVAKQPAIDYSIVQRHAPASGMIFMEKDSHRSRIKSPNTPQSFGRTT